MDIKYIYEDLWNIFNHRIYWTRSFGIIDALEFINAFQEISIELSESEQQAITKFTTLDYNEWMDLMQNNKIMINAMAKWRQLHSHYLQNIN